MFNRFAIAAAAIATSTTLIAPTVDAKPVTTVSIETGDLDLRSPAGRKALRERVERVAVEACGKAHPIDLQGKREVRQCRAHAMLLAQDVIRRRN
ncbi:UrcA family protein [Sphingomicrobium aestuariivivum]|uniref:UrcA family protein n=1 Tax=Sphingomicrobium aestuariivivum TaxID=1582356 RepID=UPI001FD69DB7|nr:UrcA family protein [Sphingomicrobium aestuariivivum]MCJ8190290.1 UrcA family protein [Sphingomicrobium aestuariivivum]